ncbi:CoA transferase [Bradyrhizobium sp. RDT10]
MYRYLVSSAAVLVAVTSSYRLTNDVPEHLHGRKMESSMGVLSHLRVVEIGSSTATSYCARLFADFGADVQKVEPPTGDPLRRSAPLTGSGQSTWFAFLNFNKSSIIIDANDADASIRLTTLIEDCDILDDRFHETRVLQQAELMERTGCWRIPRLRSAKRGAVSWQDGGERSNWQ